MEARRFAGSTASIFSSAVARSITLVEQPGDDMACVRLISWYRESFGSFLSSRIEGEAGIPCTEELSSWRSCSWRDELFEKSSEDTSRRNSENGDALSSSPRPTSMRPSVSLCAATARVATSWSRKPSLRRSEHTAGRCDATCTSASSARFASCDIADPSAMTPTAEHPKRRWIPNTVPAFALPSAPWLTLTETRVEMRNLRATSRVASCSSIRSSILWVSERTMAGERKSSLMMLSTCGSSMICRRGPLRTTAPGPAAARAAAPTLASCLALPAPGRGTPGCRPARVCERTGSENREAMPAARSRRRVDSATRCGGSVARKSSSDVSSTSWRSSSERVAMNDALSISSIRDGSAGGSAAAAVARRWASASRWCCRITSA
mmetsp:Transcript_57343/g.136341  ORF Transcript_57343/g.136341 Transcript_57343/m.136341 type:complete len:380 (-) Transcript_57343:278-1417(-)